jgi:hypothetical protein
MSDVILSDETLSSSTFSHVIAMPIEKINIADCSTFLKLNIIAAVRPTTSTAAQPSPTTAPVAYSHFSAKARKLA